MPLAAVILKGRLFLVNLSQLLQWSLFWFYSSDSGVSVSLPHICFLYCMQLWYPWKQIFQESVQILHAVLVLRLYQVNWTGWWIYWIGPLAGALLASLACSLLAKKITIAKLYHFDSESEGDILLRRSEL